MDESFTQIYKSIEIYWIKHLRATFLVDDTVRAGAEIDDEIDDDDNFCFYSILFLQIIWICFYVYHHILNINDCNEQHQMQLCLNYSNLKSLK